MNAGTWLYNQNATPANARTSSDSGSNIVLVFRIDTADNNTYFITNPKIQVTPNNTLNLTAWRSAGAGTGYANKSSDDGLGDNNYATLKTKSGALIIRVGAIDLANNNMKTLVV